MLSIAGEERTNWYGLLHIDVPVLADQQGLTSALPRHCQERWVIGMDGEKECQGTLCYQHNSMLITCGFILVSTVTMSWPLILSVFL